MRSLTTEAEKGHGHQTESKDCVGGMRKSPRSGLYRPFFPSRSLWRAEGLEALRHFAPYGLHGQTVTYTTLNLIAH